MNIVAVYVMWICVFMLKVFDLIDLTWWFVAPLAFLAVVGMTCERK